LTKGIAVLNKRLTTKKAIVVLVAYSLFVRFRQSPALFLPNK
jgi:hypothetical protein